MARQFGHTWWGQAWIDALEGRADLDPNRLPRGRTYARQGHVNRLELEPGRRIRHTDAFDDPNLPGGMVVTVDLKQVSCGTEVSIVQEGIPEMIPTEACYLGWQESHTLLTQLVEPEIPD